MLIVIVAGTLHMDHHSLSGAVLPDGPWGGDTEAATVVPAHQERERVDAHAIGAGQLGKRYV